MECTICTGQVEQARAEIGITTCKACAEKTVRPYKGTMVYSGKDTADINIMSAETFEDFKRYVPYGHNTGRGSGVHRVMESSNQ